MRFERVLVAAFVREKRIILFFTVQLVTGSVVGIEMRCFRHTSRNAFPLFVRVNFY